MKARHLAAALVLSAAAAAAATPPPAPLDPHPSPAQLAWQRMELTMFLHFGVNTFTDREWGEGQEDPAVFNPSALDARQWVRTAQAAGFKLMILTAKHHDGFCLFQSAQTDHGVARSPWREGKGDVVREFAEACRAEGMKVGLYLSPWDRHQASYGTDGYNEHFKKQLAELLTHYGPVDEVWFDGACGEGPNGRKQVYDWDGYYAVIRQLAPQALIAIMGPDIRWVGNESGVARLGESSVQRKGDRPVWHPAECDVSIRPGWFYHADQDAKVKSLDHLLDIYFKSAGRNSVLLLNVPPDRRGLIADADVRRLGEFRAALDEMFREDLARGRAARASATRGGDERFGPARALDGDADSYWATADGVTNGWLEVDLGQDRTFNIIDVREAFALGERVQKYHVEAEVGGVWTTLASGRVIGSRNLLPIAPCTARKVRLVVDAATVCPAIAGFGLYHTARPLEIAARSLTASKPCRESNVHPGGTVYGGDKAVDDDMNTRWATSDDTRACWLEVDLLQPETIGRLAIAELDARITRFEVQYKLAAGDAWSVAYKGGKAGRNFSASFPPVSARYVRLDIQDATKAPTLWEFQVLAPGRK